ncbi:MAG: FecR domain-containing protein [Reyranellales bacterium]
MLLPVVSKTLSMRIVVTALATVLIGASPGSARVGVTSQTDGDPKGKPPSQAERVLRVGIDIQANETITTKDDDRAHLVFLDGTSLTVAPNAQLVIDKFVYDPDKKRGELAISVATGVFRLVGGKISKTAAIVVSTPSASIGVRGGIGLFAVTPDETKAHFIFGISMTVVANGRTEIATRPGSQIFTKLGGAPGTPSLIPVGGTAQMLAALEGRSSKGDGAADETAKTSGFSDQNSGQGTGLGQGVSAPLGRGTDVTQDVKDTTLQRGLGTIETGGSFSAGTTTPFFGGSQPGSPSASPGGPSPGGPPPGGSPGPSPGPPLAGHPQAIPDGHSWGGFTPAVPATPVRGGWRQ